MRYWTATLQVALVQMKSVPSARLSVISKQRSLSWYGSALKPNENVYGFRRMNSMSALQRI